jgi:hypothetical protein
MMKKTQGTCMTFLKSVRVFLYEIWNGSSPIIPKRKIWPIQQVMEKTFQFIVHTSQVWMGTVKNFLTHSVEHKSLSTKFQIRMELRYRQLLHS